MQMNPYINKCSHLLICYLFFITIAVIFTAWDWYNYILKKFFLKNATY